MFLGFLEVSVLKWDDIDIDDTYMRLYLEQSKTHIDWSGQWLCISNWIQFYALSSLHENIYES